MKLFTDANLISLHFLRRRVRLTVGNFGSCRTDLRFGSTNIVPERPLKIHWQQCQYWRQRNILLRIQRKPGLTTKSTNAKTEGYLAELRRAGFTQSMFALTQNQGKNNSSAFSLMLLYAFSTKKKKICACVYERYLYYTYMHIRTRIFIYMCIYIQRIFSSVLYYICILFLSKPIAFTALKSYPISFSSHRDKNVWV